eukprot:scaffold28085_cov26-Phaeocystis_antarctica.AAC.2
MEQKAEAEAEAEGVGRAGVPLGTHVPPEEPLDAPPDMVVIGCPNPNPSPNSNPNPKPSPNPNPNPSPNPSPNPNPNPYHRWSSDARSSSL